MTFHYTPVAHSRLKVNGIFYFIPTESYIYQKLQSLTHPSFTFLSYQYSRGKRTFRVTGCLLMHLVRHCRPITMKCNSNKKILKIN